MPEEEFAFTIAIGRQAKTMRDPFEESRMEIDVSVPPDTESYEADAVADPPVRSSISPLFPVTSLAERRLAALIDVAFLLFAYGGFLTLFGSLGGQFTLSKLNAAVYAATLALFYFQYFALFTVFGGTTPGMMLRNLHLVRFTGEPPTPKQLLLRSLGYLLSAGSFFLGLAAVCRMQTRAARCIAPENPANWRGQLLAPLLPVHRTALLLPLIR